MSHPEQLGFFTALAAPNTALIKAGRVLEIGSYDVNGSVRRIFGDAGEYIGVDLEEGPGVDAVGFGHEYDAPEGSFDLAISGECFEHDPHWAETFTNMARLTRPGGLVAFTCASRGRPEHGTTRTRTVDSPGTQAVGLDYYRNLVEADFAKLPLDQWFSSYRFWFGRTHFDLYFAGIRKGGETQAVLPSDAAIGALDDLMSLPHRMARLPLRALARTRMTEERYQRVVVPYWQFLLKIAGDGVVRSERTTVA